jgi:hypothetical protein
VAMVGRDDVAHAADSVNDLGRGAHALDHLVDRHLLRVAVGSRPVHDQRAVPEVANRGPKPEAIAPFSVSEGQLKLQLARCLLVEVGKQLERGRGLGRGFRSMAREQEDAPQGEDEPCPGKDEQSEKRSFHVVSTSRLKGVEPKSSRRDGVVSPLALQSTDLLFQSPRLQPQQRLHWNL